MRPVTGGGGEEGEEGALPLSAGTVEWASQQEAGLVAKGVGLQVALPREGVELKAEGGREREQ